MGKNGTVKLSVLSAWGGPVDDDSVMLMKAVEQLPVQRAIAGYAIYGRARVSMRLWKKWIITLNAVSVTLSRSLKKLKRNAGTLYEQKSWYKVSQNNDRIDKYSWMPWRRRERKDFEVELLNNLRFVTRYCSFRKDSLHCNYSKERNLKKRLQQRKPK